MSSYLLFLILGLGSGATYAILGQGLVLKYRSAGVVDFAHGAVAMFIAYVFVNLRSFGQLELPVVLIPHQISLNGGAGLNTGLAIVISLVYAAIFGLVLYVLIYRPLRGASPLTRVCASVGVMLSLQAIAVLNYSTEPVATNPIFPSSALSISKITFPEDRLFFTGVVVVISAALALTYRFSRFGLATRAGAENDRGAALTGISANRVAGQNWVIATVLAGAAGILIAPVASLDPTSYTLFVVPALAAALVGRFQSFWITALAGLLIGCAQSEIEKLITVWTWLPQQGLPDALPFAVIIVVMALRSRSVLARGGDTAERNPSVGRPVAPLRTAAACFVAGLILLLVLSNVLRFAFISSLTVTCIALSVVVLTGYVGQVSLAQMSLAGIGGFTLGHISSSWHIGFPWSLILAGLCAVPVGLIIGLPALRLRGVNLAVVTLGFAAAMDAVVFNSQSFTGGTAGLPIPEPRLPGLNLAISQGKSYPTVIFGVVVLIVVILLALLVARLRRGPAGRMLLAIRSNERAAGSVGINVAQGKLMAFGLAAFIAGVGGALTGYMQGELTSDSFAAFTSISLLAIVFVAGVGRIAGAVVAGIMFSAAGLFVTFLDLHLNVGKYQAIVAGVALVLTAVQNPDGITSTATGKGPAVALVKLRDRAAAEYAKRLAGRAPSPRTGAGSPVRSPGPGVEGDELSAESDRRPRTASGPLSRRPCPWCGLRSSGGTPWGAGRSRPCAGGCRAGRRSSTPTGCVPTTASTPAGWTARPSCSSGCRSSTAPAARPRRRSRCGPTWARASGASRPGSRPACCPTRTGRRDG
jgi:ABC-type branched-subunit amino acid transport system permease subunit